MNRPFPFEFNRHNIYDPKFLKISPVPSFKRVSSKQSHKYEVGTSLLFQSIFNKTCRCVRYSTIKQEDDFPVKDARYIFHLFNNGVDIGARMWATHWFRAPSADRCMCLHLIRPDTQEMEYFNAIFAQTPTDIYLFLFLEYYFFLNGNERIDTRIKK